ncbi:MAG: hypothetical protein Kow0077_25930 [Anaerolineae bacterium]
MPPANEDMPPAGYKLVHRLNMTSGRAMIWLNVAATLIFVAALSMVFASLLLYARQGSPWVLPDQPVALPLASYFLMLAATLVLHEAMHGLAMLIFGKRPRFGARLTRLVLYTTSDAYFPRTEYLIVTLAPLVVLSLLGLSGMLLMPQGVAIWVGIMVAMNTASSVGDLWMAGVIVRFPGETLFRDEADGMSVYLPD